MKEQIELKTACSNLLQGVQQCFGYELCSKLEQTQIALENEKLSQGCTLNLTIDLILPKNEKDNFETCSRSTAERTFIYVNQRPVQDKKIEKILKKSFQDKYPIEKAFTVFVTFQKKSFVRHSLSDFLKFR